MVGSLPNLMISEISFLEGCIHTSNLQIWEIVNTWVQHLQKPTHRNIYRSGTVNSNTVNSKFHLIRSCCEYLARFLSFHV